MKKLILLSILTWCFCTTLKAQTKTDSVKKPKTYTLFLQVDSAYYPQIAESLNKIYNCLDKSDAPHHDVNESMAFIKMLYQQFEVQKKEQDKPKKK